MKKTQQRILVHQKLLETIRDHNKGTFNHSLRCADLMISILSDLDMEDKSIDNLIDAALLHDYGKVFIPASILNKPGPLTKSERVIIDRHAPMGALVLGQQGINKEIVQMVNHHHDDRTRRMDIDTALVSLVDIYDALINNRPYKEALDKSIAVEILRFEFKNVPFIKPFIATLEKA